MTEPITTVKDAISESIAVKQDLLADDAALATLVEMAELTTRAIAGGGKLLICGNGGSAADAQHLAAELVVRLRSEVNRTALPALTLALDTSTVTACGNDYGFDDIFARALEALGKPGDILLGITTSGKSPNVLKALDQAEAMGIQRFGFLGGDGGPALQKCDHAFIAPSKTVARIQECHITAGHILMQLIEDMSITEGSASRI